MNLAFPTPDKTMEKVLSLAEEASRLADDASREVERILDLSDEDLEQALQEARDKAASLLRRKKALGLVEIRRQNANQRRSVEAAELPAASVKRQASTPRMQSDAERRLFDVDFQVQPSLKELEFIDQEAERVVHRQVSARYDPEHVRRPAVEEFDIPSDYHLAVLKHELAFTRQAAHAESTKSAHMLHWKTYAKFCLYFGFKSPQLTQRLFAFSLNS